METKTGRTIYALAEEGGGFFGAAETIPELLDFARAHEIRPILVVTVWHVPEEISPEFVLARLRGAYGWPEMQDGDCLDWLEMWRTKDYENAYIREDY